MKMVNLTICDCKIGALTSKSQLNDRVKSRNLTSNRKVYYARLLTAENSARSFFPNASQMVEKHQETIDFKSNFKILKPLDTKSLSPPPMTVQRSKNGDIEKRSI